MFQLSSSVELSLLLKLVAPLNMASTFTRFPEVTVQAPILWLNDELKLKEMSDAAKLAGRPNAARDIVKQIGDSTLKWKSLNDGQFTEIINSEDLDDDEKEKEAIAKIMAEEEKINADILASAELSKNDATSIPLDSEVNGTIWGVGVDYYSSNGRNMVELKIRSTY